ncbi:YceD family protein [Luethyella okanaganae]|uniref:YceD family protein n=1 Tax=Luethyella okanaganae TaxID=69372 RepID=A0ABW1VB63_9MICO
MSTFSKSPFAISVRDLVHRPGEMREFTLDVPASEDLGEGLVAVRAGGSIDVSVRLESVHEGILATAEIDATAAGVCGRCLIDIEIPVQVEFQELFAYSSGEAFEFEVQDDHVDLEPLIRDAVVLALPFQPVCRPDCPGLDPETGERLARHPELTAQETRDPRWAALAELQASTDIGSGGDVGADMEKER